MRKAEVQLAGNFVLLRIPIHMGEAIGPWSRLTFVPRLAGKQALLDMQLCGSSVSPREKRFIGFK
jgi:hypothetical protein